LSVRWATACLGPRGVGSSLFRARYRSHRRLVGSVAARDSGEAGEGRQGHGGAVLATDGAVPVIWTVSPACFEPTISASVAAEVLGGGSLTERCAPRALRPVVDQSHISGQPVFPTRDGSVATLQHFCCERVLLKRECRHARPLHCVRRSRGYQRCALRRPSAPASGLLRRPVLRLRGCRGLSSRRGSCCRERRFP
jgi:hypothetical protein